MIIVMTSTMQENNVAERRYHMGNVVVVCECALCQTNLVTSGGLFHQTVR